MTKIALHKSENTKWVLFVLWLKVWPASSIRLYMYIHTLDALSWVTTFVFLQELLHLNVAAAESALRHFQSCVRTTLLLCNGYECQEKVSHVLTYSSSSPPVVMLWSHLLWPVRLSSDWYQCHDLSWGSTLMHEFLTGMPDHIVSRTVANYSG